MLVALVIFLINRNQKDEAAFEEQQNNDDPKPKVDAEPEELTK